MNIGGRIYRDSQNKKVEEIMDIKEKIEKAAHQAAVTEMQKFLDDATKEGVSGTDLLELLQSDDLKEYLDDVTFTSGASEGSEASEKESDKQEEEEEKPAKAARKHNLKAVEKTKKYVANDSPERNKQRELIFRTVSVGGQETTGKDIALALSKKFPELQPWTINGLVSQMVANKSLRRTRQKGTKVWYYGVGKKPA